MIRTYLLLGTTALLGNGVTLAPIVDGYRRAAHPTALTRSEPSPGATATAYRSTYGLFRLTGWINRRPVTFIVDTGATVTVLSSRDARRLGLRPDLSDRTGSLSTAGGAAPITWKRIGTLAIAGAQVDADEVAITEERASHSLLGQDVLSRLGAITMIGDRLEIRPHAS